jgi:hypothetical protein
MLQKYLIEAPTITEKISLLTSPKNSTKLAGDKVGETKEFIRDWQASWEKKSQRG